MQHEQFRKEYLKRKDEENRFDYTKNNISVTSIPLNIEISNIDQDLKYTYIFNPLHNFDKNHYLGKRDDQIDSSKGSKLLQNLKKRVIKTGKPGNSIIEFSIPGGTKTCSVSVVPLIDKQGRVTGAICASADITNYTIEVVEQNKSITELQQAISNIKTMHGILPVCSYCKSIKDGSGNWQEFNTYISQHTNAHLSHGVCPDCLKSLYPDFQKT